MCRQRLSELVVILGALALSPAASAQFKTLYVDHDAPGNNDGTSWYSAYHDLEDAASAACADPQTFYRIFVAGGTYRRGEWQLCANVFALYGGFSGFETQPRRCAGGTLDGNACSIVEFP